MNRTLASAASVVLAALACGTAANLVSPRRIPWVADWAHHVQTQAARNGLQVVDLAQARQIVAAGTSLVFDARPPAAYGAGHLPGAISLPVDAFDTQYPQYAPVLDAGTPILVYCSGTECDESLLLGTRLREQGCTNVSIFPGGYSAWTATAGGGAR